jgi:hypothetical protein
VIDESPPTNKGDAGAAADAVLSDDARMRAVELKPVEDKADKPVMNIYMPGFNIWRQGDSLQIAATMTKPEDAERVKGSQQLMLRGPDDTALIVLLIDARTPAEDGDKTDSSDIAGDTPATESEEGTNPNGLEGEA